MQKSGAVTSPCNNTHIYAPAALTASSAAIAAGAGVALQRVNVAIANPVGVGVNRPGAFAEYIAVPAFNVFKLPDAISDDMASILDPLGNATHTALSFDLVGEDVLITGAGPIGIMAVAIARYAGARHVVITDVNDYRLELARNMGASHTVNVTRSSIADIVRELEIEGFDIGLEMSGNAAAFDDLLHHMYHGGKVALLGILPSGSAIESIQYYTSEETEFDLDKEQD